MRIRPIYNATFVGTIMAISLCSWACPEPSLSSVNAVNFSQLADIDNKIKTQDLDQLSPENHQAIKNVLHDLEGSGKTKEKIGYSRWGIGYGSSQGLHPKNIDQAVNIFWDKYIQHSEFKYAKPVMQAMEKLGPDAVFAWAQLVLHRPAWANRYARAWLHAGKKNFADLRFVDYVLTRQRHDYLRTEPNSKDLVGHLNRVRESRQGGYDKDFNLTPAHILAQDNAAEKRALASVPAGVTTPTASSGASEAVDGSFSGYEAGRESSTKTESLQQRSSQKPNALGSD